MFSFSELKQGDMQIDGVLIRVALQVRGTQSIGRSVRPSWRRAPFGTHGQMLVCCQTITSLVVMGRHPWHWYWHWYWLHSGRLSVDPWGQGIEPCGTVAGDSYCYILPEGRGVRQGYGVL